MKKTEAEEYAKLCDAAAKKREVNVTLRRKMLEDPKFHAEVSKRLVADLKRVFECQQNPYKGFSASRQRYRQLGWFPEILVVDVFGNHEEFQRAAGLRDSRGTTKVRNTIAKLATERRVQEYAERSVLTGGTYDTKLTDRDEWKGLKKVLVGSDFHSQFVDPFALEVFLDAIDLVKPDLVVLNGDVVEFSSVSRHTKMPGAANLSLQGEIDFCRERILRPVRQRAGDAAITWHIGNHEHRLVRYLADVAPDLAELKCLDWKTLFAIDDLGVELVFGGDFMAPAQWQRRNDVEKRTWRIYWDSWAVTHGNSTSRHAAAQELSRFGISGTSGHSHRPQMFSRPTATCPTATWMTTGMLAGFAVGHHYVQGPSAWTMGFGFVVVDPERRVAIQEPVTVHEHLATFMGRVWRPTKKVLEARSEMLR